MRFSSNKKEMIVYIIYIFVSVLKFQLSIEVSTGLFIINNILYSVSYLIKINE